MTDRELMQQAFERMTGVSGAWTNPAFMQSRNGFIQGWEAGASDLRERLAQPLRTHWEGCDEVHPECKQPRREWVGLTEEEIKILWIQYRAALPRYLCFALAIEAALREKNT